MAGVGPVQPMVASAEAGGGLVDRDYFAPPDRNTSPMDVSIAPTWVDPHVLVAVLAGLGGR